MRKKVSLIFLLLAVMISAVSARTHYIIAAPLGVRLEMPLSPGYQAGIQDFSFLWGGSTTSTTTGNTRGTTSYRPIRYMSERITNNINDGYGHTIGLHFAFEGGTISYLETYPSYYSQSHEFTIPIIQGYVGFAFRQFFARSFFIYEAIGTTLGTGVIGAYGDIGLMYESSFGFVINLGIRCEAGYSVIAETENIGLSFGTYLGLGYAF